MDKVTENLQVIGEIVAVTYGYKIPSKIWNEILIKPIFKIDLIQDDLQKADQAEITRLMDKIDVGILEQMQKDGVAITKQMAFWTAYYKHLTTQDEFVKFDREALIKCGNLLFGKQWQTDLANALNLNVRRVREWLAGERKIPFGVFVDIKALLKQRQILIDEALSDIVKK